ncbi:MAG: RyR domain-containing protein, partial [Deltaproteobacteria bacterium]|nr:RyR domain-containing protein [Deltaproteobacteria bacterium]
SLVGCEIGPVTDWDAPLEFQFTPDETERLSSLEHERWMSEKLEGGWRYGEKRDDAQKIHPSLVPYENLSEPEKEKDRDTIRQIPEILSRIDFQVSRK